jgi:mRNA interferase RelE/StbE
LANLDRSVAPRLEGDLRARGHDPRPHGCVKLSGERDQYRIRIGQYRIGYAIDDLKVEF